MLKIKVKVKNPENQNQKVKARNLGNQNQKVKVLSHLEHRKENKCQKVRIQKKDQEGLQVLKISKQM